ncbi:hypothetical protein FJY63_02485, partial [Candidatus Sumerlaeota bacterium]|nr:hypothetical protein [Candidatus Sumerlaeota bacterium]
ALAALGRDGEALAELDRLLAEAPDFVAALWTKAVILARRNETDQARDLARRAIERASPATAAEILADPIIRSILDF